MKEHIERAAVEEMLENAHLISDGEYCGYCTEDVNLGSIPAADVALVRHGRWHLAEDAVFRCSECGRICYELDAPYCYCGARMDKEDEHEAG